jgi:DNA-binding NarL/FixJ family response regulator
MHRLSLENVLIFDDQKMITDLLKNNLKSEKIAKNVDTCLNINQARSLINLKNYCIAILDIKIGNNTKKGFEIAKYINKKSPNTHVIFMSFLSDYLDVVNFLESDFNTFVCKSDGYNELLSAIKAISLGNKSYHSPRVQKLINEYNSRVNTYSQEKLSENLLTKREIQIIIQISKGIPHKIIADSLSLKICTVKKHVQNIYKKLGINNKVEIIKYAIDNQFIKLSA